MADKAARPPGHGCQTVLAVAVAPFDDQHQGYVESVRISGSG